MVALLGRSRKAVVEVDPVERSADLIIAANRLPLEHFVNGDQTGWRRSPGGLVSALAPALSGHSALWVGCSGREPGSAAAPMSFGGDSSGCRYQEILLDPSLEAAFYSGFCNSAIWPLYHNGVVPPSYSRSEFDAYRHVNTVFANRIAELAASEATVWVHDYQLQLLPRMLRDLRPDLRIGFFLHIPFPPQELFAQLPWRRHVLEGLLGADLVGFQTEAAATNFLALTQQLLGLRTSGDRVEVDAIDGARDVIVRSFPIGIDVAHYEELARDPAVMQRADEVRRELGDPRVLVLGVDRLDYTKGVGVRLQAFSEFVESLPPEDRDVTLLQVATPSRELVEEYKRIRAEVERLVGRANGDLGTTGYRPIHYLHQSLDDRELVALYLAADVMLVTPFSDGMNLVAKEYVACRTSDDGALVLSEFTGAAQELRDAWLVNPFDVDAVKRVIGEAIAATPAERTRRMKSMRQRIGSHDVFAWFEDFMSSLAA